MLKRQLFRAISRRRGFTLVELLVVIGIIAILMSILLPTLGRVKEQAKSIKCRSNLRQLSMAMIGYCQNNREYYPRPAGGGVTSEDWIYWQNTAARPLDESRILPYVGGGSTFPEEFFQCPTDEVLQRPPGTSYRFSYSVNFNMCTLVSQGPTLKTSHVRSPANKIIFIEESNITLDDGCWAWQADLGLTRNLLSARHDREFENLADKNRGRGNAGFCDGHVEVITREDSFKPEYWKPSQP